MDLNTYSTVDLAERLKISLDLLMLVSMTQNGLSTIWASYASLSTTFSLSSLLLDAVRTIRRRAAAPECTWKSWFLLIRRAIVHLCTCAPLVANLSANSTHVTRGGIFNRSSSSNVREKSDVKITIFTSNWKTT